MIDFIPVTEKSHGRRVLVNWRHVEAITDDGDHACIVFHRPTDRKTRDDWDADMPGCLTCVESFDALLEMVRP